MANPRDQFFDGNQTTSAVDGFAITPNDGANLPDTARAIYVGGTGDVTLITPRGTSLLFKAVPTGQYIFAYTNKVMATGTTATNLVGLL